MYERLNDDALDYYLRGEGGESCRREALEELYRRGQESADATTSDTLLVDPTVEEMVEILRACGWVVFKPKGH